MDITIVTHIQESEANTFRLCMCHANVCVCALRVHTVPCLPPCWRISLKNHVAAIWLPGWLWTTLNHSPLKSSQPFCRTFSDKAMWGVPKMGIPPVLIHLFIEFSSMNHGLPHLRKPPYNLPRNLHHSQDYRGHPPNLKALCELLPCLFAGLGAPGWNKLMRAAPMDVRTCRTCRKSQPCDFWTHRSTCWKGQNVLLPAASQVWWVHVPVPPAIPQDPRDLAKHISEIHSSCPTNSTPQKSNAKLKSIISPALLLSSYVPEHLWSETKTTWPNCNDANSWKSCRAMLCGNGTGKNSTWIMKCCGHAHSRAETSPCVSVLLASRHGLLKDYPK